MNISKPKLYYSPGACSLAPHIILEEIGKPYDKEEVTLSQGKQLTTDYKAIHPLQRVPALQINEQILTENGAILEFLGDLFPESQLIPKSGSWERARVSEWCFFLASSVHPAFAQIWRASRFSDIPETHQAIQSSGRKNIEQYFSLIEEKLQSQSYAVSESYSICDAYLLVFYRWGYRINLPMTEYTAFTKHAHMMLKRPAVQRTLQQEGIVVIPNL